MKNAQTVYLRLRLGEVNVFLNNRPKCFLCGRKVSPVIKYQYYNNDGIVKQICNYCSKKNPPRKVGIKINWLSDQIKKENYMFTGRFSLPGEKEVVIWKPVLETLSW